MDPILYWNEVAAEADRTTHTTLPSSELGVRGGPGGARANAIVHLAMHDAYFGINTGHYEPYLGDDLPEAPPGADSAAAVASAAHAVLSALYPTQKAFFDARHAAAGLIASKADVDGHDFGRKVASKIIALRKNDPGFGDNGHSFSVAPGRHRQDPDNPGQGFYGPFYGARSACFAATTRHHLDAPPQPGSAEYEQAIKEVRAKGIAPHLMGTLPAELQSMRRTPTETGIGLWWGYEAANGIGTPTRLYNQIIRKIAVAQGNDEAQNARLFALVNAAIADSTILAWADKYEYDLWRPVLGIREHDASLGPAGVGGNELDADSDPGWLPLGAQATNVTGGRNFTPSFPAYPSGHASEGGAAFQMVRHFYGQTQCGPDNLADNLEFVSDELDGISTDVTGNVRTRVVRTFPGGCWQMMIEQGFSRVFLGVHWVFDAFAVDENGDVDLSRNIGGVKLGMDIADDLAANGLKASAAAGPVE
ncbi:vanadium-dependent haloperoxidase [Kibdelosporangium persicum]|uniref:Vanadium chloroperoxidase n=1 Tax=Kibdelosporangium persicum TaxID=2698649 RepID=A0ABX2FGJ9_9PSEU|nr:vanadium-dependent haloperoxidase [Kibdelosporangium persicum]NRN70353.1 Vanadium chloroperoxidase [Kibdelosporangium persicum]